MSPQATVPAPQTVPGFLHTSPVHVATFDRLLAQRVGTGDDASGVEAARHLVDEGLLADARADGPETVAGRVRDRLAELRDLGASIVCCTCSTIGAVAERCGDIVPVFRVDRPMAARAVQLGRRVGVVAALESTLEPTRALLEEEAHRAAVGAGDAGAEMRLVLAEGAWERFEAGDRDGYLAAVARACRELAPDVDVVVLAQASMADAVHLLGDLAVPVLASPAFAVERLLSGPPVR